MSEKTQKLLVDTGTWGICGICGREAVMFDLNLDINICLDCGAHETFTGWQVGRPPEKPSEKKAG